MKTAFRIESERRFFYAFLPDVVGTGSPDIIRRKRLVFCPRQSRLGVSANYPEKVISLVCDGALEGAYGAYSTWEGTDAANE